MLVLVAALSVCLASAHKPVAGWAARQAVIKAGGRTFAGRCSWPAPAIIPDVPSTEPTRIEVNRARMAADQTRASTVRQGWLSTAGAVAICAPIQMSLALSGRRADYDSLAYWKAGPRLHLVSLLGRPGPFL